MKALAMVPPMTMRKPSALKNDIQLSVPCAIAPRIRQKPKTVPATVASDIDWTTRSIGIFERVSVPIYKSRYALKKCQEIPNKRLKFYGFLVNNRPETGHCRRRSVKGAPQDFWPWT